MPDRLPFISFIATNSRPISLDGSHPGTIAIVRSPRATCSTTTTTSSSGFTIARSSPM
ncbi:hypothetical protein I6G79_33045 [Burkholderia plantarii]|nr:hypothetical protein [Burkholderia plantarii]MBI0331769.1 hypothetical protein [Burkholderia plantarii]